MKTIVEISKKQSRDAEIAIFCNPMLRNGLVQSASNVWEYEPDLDMEIEEDREQYDDFVEELKMILDLAYIDEYEITKVDAKD